jgi:uncharacterized protein
MRTVVAAAPARCHVCCMEQDGKLDYLEIPTHGATLSAIKEFYRAAFSWQFTDHGPSYASFDEGLRGGFDASADATPRPLPVLYAKDLEAARAKVEEAGGRITRPIFSFPGGRRFHFVDPGGNELAVWSE